MLGTAAFVALAMTGTAPTPVPERFPPPSLFDCGSVHSEAFVGTDDPDRWEGSPRGNVIGYGGNDFLHNRSVMLVCISGGAGDDTLIGGR